MIERKQVWFNAECREIRKLQHKALKKFCTSHSDEERNKYLQKKKKSHFVRIKKTTKTL